MIRDTSFTHLQQRRVHAVYLRADGQPAQVEGNQTWESEDPTVVRVEPSADGVSAVLISTGLVTPAGQPVRVFHRADARFGEEEVLIAGQINVTITRDTRDEAADVDFTFDAPEDR